MVEVFQPFGSEAWPSSQRDGVFQSQEVVLESPGRSADREGTVIVAQGVDLRGEGSIRLASQARPQGGPWRVAPLTPAWSSPGRRREEEGWIRGGR